MYTLLIFLVIYFSLIFTVKKIEGGVNDGTIAAILIGFLGLALIFFPINFLISENYLEKKTEHLRTSDLNSFTIDDQNKLFMANLNEIQVYTDKFYTLDLDKCEIFYIEEDEQPYIETYKTDRYTEESNWYLIKASRDYSYTTWKIFIPRSSVNSSSFVFKDASEEE